METVNLIAAGYEWECPVCDVLNTTIEVTEHVTCKGCGRIFKTNPPDHAY